METLVYRICNRIHDYLLLNKGPDTLDRWHYFRMAIDNRYRVESRFEDEMIDCIMRCEAGEDEYDDYAAEEWVAAEEAGVRK